MFALGPFALKVCPDNYVYNYMYDIKNKWSIIIFDGL
jgi:hypothetical protein